MQGRNPLLLQGTTRYAARVIEAMQMRPVVSVVIVNWNTRQLLHACLASLPWDSPLVALEVIVVDNGSEDGSVEMVATDYPQVKLIRNPGNVGFVRANNQGLRAATGDFIFMLNSDTEVRRGCIERLVEVISRDENIGAVGPRLVNPDGTYQRSAGLFPRLLFRILPSIFERHYDKQLEKLAASGRTRRVDWLSGAALFTTRRVLEQVGPLDERYFMWYDDLDWCQKLRRAGYDRVFVPDAVVMHHGRQSGAKLQNLQLQEQLWDSEYTYLRLNGGLLTTWLVFGLRVAKALMRWCLSVSPTTRKDAAWRLSYHRRRLLRFCRLRLPPADCRPVQSSPAVGNE